MDTGGLIPEAWVSVSTMICISSTVIGSLFTIQFGFQRHSHAQADYLLFVCGEVVPSVAGEERPEFVVVSHWCFDRV